MIELDENYDCQRHGHATIVVHTRRLRDWLRTRFWVRCWCCELRTGPFVTRGEGELERILQDRA